MTRAKTIQVDLCPRCLQKSGRDSVISHNGEGSELAQSGFVFPLPLLIRVAGLVKLLGQVSEDLLHFRVVPNLRTTRLAGAGLLGYQDPWPCTLLGTAGQEGPENILEAGTLLFPQAEHPR